jgi:hypothetical protein
MARTELRLLLRSQAMAERRKGHPFRMAFRTKADSMTVMSATVATTARATASGSSSARRCAARASTTRPCTTGSSGVGVYVAGTYVPRTYAWTWGRPVSPAVAWSAMGICGSAAVWARAISSSAGGYEAMTAPAVTIAPVSPGAYAQEDAVIEVAGAVEADRSTGIGRVVVVAVGADRGWPTYVDGNLCIGLGHRGHKGD